MKSRPRESHGVCGFGLLVWSLSLRGLAKRLRDSGLVKRFEHEVGVLFWTESQLLFLWECKVGDLEGSPNFRASPMLDAGGADINISSIPLE